MKKGVCPKKKLSVYVLGIFFWLFGEDDNFVTSTNILNELTKM